MNLFWPALVILTAAFSVFPLTDTDIWWHLACAREWVTTWTPVRTPVVNVHEYFQLVSGFIFDLGGAPLLVAFKSLLWGLVFGLFLWPIRTQIKWIPFVLSAALLFLLRYQMEMRPVLFSLLFLGLYWNILPLFFRDGSKLKKSLVLISLLVLQWIWCKTQGLFPLGVAFAVGLGLTRFFEKACGPRMISSRQWGAYVMFVLLLLAMPFLHEEGLRLFLYPFGLLDRLLGLTSSAVVFSLEIAENRSPVTLLMESENVVTSLTMILMSLLAFAGAFYLRKSNAFLSVCLFATACLAMIAERNGILMLPVFCVALQRIPFACSELWKKTILVVLMALLGVWVRSMLAYDTSMISYQRVPVEAAEWMKNNPHQGRLFNDDRAGGYLAFVNPSDSIYIDGRFILKTSDFFQQYLGFAENPEAFMRYADSLGIDRTLFPLRYYARWGKVIDSLVENKQWFLAYRDEYFCVFQRNY